MRCAGGYETGEMRGERRIFAGCKNEGPWERIIRINQHCIASVFLCDAHARLWDSVADVSTQDLAVQRD